MSSGHSLIAYVLVQKFKNLRAVFAKPRLAVLWLYVSLFSGIGWSLVPKQSTGTCRAVRTFLVLGEDPQMFTLFAPSPPKSIGRSMKTTYLLATLFAATLPLTAVLAETETTDQKQEQNSETTGMKGMMGKGQMMSDLKDQDAELDKLVAEMNSASADKKLDAVSAVVTKLVEQRKAMHEQMQKMTSANEKGMCKCQ
jgi:hypothetical protein